MSLSHALTVESSTAVSLAGVATIRSCLHTAETWHARIEFWWHARQLASSLLIAPPACVGPLIEWNPGWDHMDCPYLALLEQPELASGNSLANA